MSTPLEEQETIIRIGRKEEYAEVYTSDTTVMTKLDKLASDPDSPWKELAERREFVNYEVVSKVYRAPKRLVSYRSRIVTHEFTEEQRAANAERLQKMRDAMQKKREQAEKDSES